MVNVQAGGEGVGSVQTHPLLHLPPQGGGTSNRCWSGPSRATTGRRQAVYRVERQERVADGHYVMWFQAPALAAAQPGQFVHVHCDNALLRRPFSLYRSDGDRVAILYRVKGQGTRWMAGLKPGDVLDVLGPLGRPFDPPADEERILLVGGGVGVAPIALYASRYGHRATLRAIVGFRSQAYVCGIEPFHDGGIPVTVMTEDGSTGQAGRVVDGLADEARRHGIDRILVCGPDRMMQAVAGIAATLGIRCDLSVERPMGCGMGICLACVVPIQDGQGGITYQRACCEGPVFNAAEVAW